MRLLYPRLADLPSPLDMRRIYLGNGWIPPIPTKDATDEQLIAFGRACADPWDTDKVQAYLDMLPNSSDFEQGDVVLFCGIRLQKGQTLADLGDWDMPQDLVDRANAMRGPGHHRPR